MTTQLIPPNCFAAKSSGH